MEDYSERYQCQIALPGFGISSQKLLKDARVLIIGMGGLGCPCAQYLASSGIGTIGIADDDIISVKQSAPSDLYILLKILDYLRSKSPPKKTTAVKSICKYYSS